jgi:hypothetical protein
MSEALEPVHAHRFVVPVLDLVGLEADRYLALSSAWWEYTTTRP